MKYPKFSVLMSIYKANTLQEINESIISLEKQTIKPNEIVIVEDGPVSKQIDDFIEKKRNKAVINFKIIRLSSNSGLGKALKIGLDETSFEWVARMDADDISLENRFEVQLSKLNEDSKIVLVGGQLKEFNSLAVFGGRKVPTSDYEIKRFARYRSPFNHPTVMFNKNAVLEAGGYKPFYHLEDYYLWGRMIAKKFTMVNCDEVVLYMRIDDDTYKRRGGLKYLISYYALKKEFKNLRLINGYQQFISDFIMTLSFLSPNWLRHIIYKGILHRDKVEKK